MMMLFADRLILMQGGGDLATGAGVRLVRAGFPLVITELPNPLSVRRTVAFAGAVTGRIVDVEGIRARLAGSAAAACDLAARGEIGVLIDPDGTSIPELRPSVVVDARMKKRPPGDGLEKAPLVIGLGPGFIAGRNCHAVVETNRGHFLGRVYWEGSAEDDTGTPDRIGGQDALRVLRAPRGGSLQTLAEIGERLAEGQVVARIGDQTVKAPFAGILRGLLAGGSTVTAGDKIGDIDPRGKRIHCFTVSDKALAVGGGVLEAVLVWLNKVDRRDPAVRLSAR
jgi:xanthine dehydrogenase accessory factor